MRIIPALVVAVTLAGTAGATQARPSGAALPRATLIGDSVAAAIQYDSGAVATLSQGIDLQLELAPCRRLGGESCPINGVRPPNAIDLIRSMGTSLGQTVIMAVGYNDYESEYPGYIDEALAALKAAGVQHVLWVTLRATDHSYLTINDDIAAAAARHPELTVVDWNMYSRSHPDWFQSDGGPHLYGYGAHAMATLFHKALVQVGIIPPPPPPLQIATGRLPDAHDGKVYSARLVAHGGTPPYRWWRVSALPRGLSLAAGRLSGKPVAPPGAYAVWVRVVDSKGLFAMREISLRVRQ